MGANAHKVEVLSKKTCFTSLGLDEIDPCQLFLAILPKNLNPYQQFDWFISGDENYQACRYREHFCETKSSHVSKWKLIMDRSHLKGIVFQQI